MSHRASRRRSTMPPSRARACRRRVDDGRRASGPVERAGTAEARVRARLAPCRSPARRSASGSALGSPRPRRAADVPQRRSRVDARRGDRASDRDIGADVAAAATIAPASFDRACRTGDLASAVELCRCARDDVGRFERADRMRLRVDRPVTALPGQRSSPSSSRDAGRRESPPSLIRSVLARARRSPSARRARAASTSRFRRSRPRESRRAAAAGGERERHGDAATARSPHQYFRFSGCHLVIANLACRRARRSPSPSG